MRIVLGPIRMTELNCLMEFPYKFSDLSTHEIERSMTDIIDAALLEKYGDNPDDELLNRLFWKAEAPPRCQFWRFTAQHAPSRPREG